MDVVVVLQVLSKCKFTEADVALELAIGVVGGLMTPHAVLRGVNSAAARKLACKGL
jgi:hypothetical protein